MKTLFITTVALAAMAAAMSAPATEFEPNGNQIVCYDPLTNSAHQNPAECARFVGDNLPSDMGGPQDFHGPGQAAQFFNGDGKGKERLTPADIFRERCRHGDEPPPDTP